MATDNVYYYSSFKQFCKNDLSLIDHLKRNRERERDRKKDRDTETDRETERQIERQRER